MAIPKPEIERRFLLSPGFLEKDFPIVLWERVYSIYQTYLDNPDMPAGTRRIRSVHDALKSENKFFLTEKTPTKDPKVRMEKERELAREEYDLLGKQADPKRDPIFKRRICFEWQDQDFELDFFKSP